MFVTMTVVAQCRRVVKECLTYLHKFPTIFKLVQAHSLPFPRIKLQCRSSIWGIAHLGENVVKEKEYLSAILIVRSAEKYFEGYTLEKTVSKEVGSKK